MRLLWLLACLLLVAPFLSGQDDEPSVRVYVPAPEVRVPEPVINIPTPAISVPVGAIVRDSVASLSESGTGFAGSNGIGVWGGDDWNDTLPTQGQWLMDVVYGDDNPQFTLRYRSTRDDAWDGYNSWSRSISLNEVQGITREQMFTPGQHVAFKLVRDAATFECDGWFANGQGSGTWKFVPSASFNNTLKQRGFTEPTPRQQFLLAATDFQLALLDELNAQKYEPFTTDDVVRMATHGISLKYVRDMKAAGYTFTSVPALIRMRDHGVAPAYIKALTAAGFTGLTAEQVLQARDHGINADYISSMTSLAHRKLALDELVRLRDHGVTPNFLAELAAAGYKDLSLDDLLRLRDHGVSASFIEDVRAHGYKNLSVDDLVKMRDHGVSAQYISEVRSTFPDASVQDLIRLRDHGVSTTFLRQYKDGRSIDEIIRLRDRGPHFN